jgi:hypothetical protein
MRIMRLFYRSLPLLCVLFLISVSVSGLAQLTNRKALSNTIEIKLPASFKLMDARMLASKYPANNHPTEAYTNDEANVNITFKKTDQSLTEQDVFTHGKKMEQDLVDKGRIELIKTEQIKVNSNNIHVFSFYSNAIDTKVYNVIFIFSSKGKLVAGSFNCTTALQSQWQLTAYEIIRSIKEI